MTLSESCYFVVSLSPDLVRFFGKECLGDQELVLIKSFSIMKIIEMNKRGRYSHTLFGHKVVRLLLAASLQCGLFVPYVLGIIICTLI